MPLFIALDCFGKASELEDQPGGNQVNVGFTCATIKGRTPRFKVGSHSMRSLTDWVKLYCASSPRDQTTSVSSALPLAPATAPLTSVFRKFMPTGEQGEARVQRIRSEQLHSHAVGCPCASRCAVVGCSQIDIANFHGNVFIHFQTTVCFPAD